MRIKFDVNGVDLLNQILARIHNAMEAFSVYAPEIVNEFETYQQAWFQSQGRGSWAPLSPRYAEWKAKHAPGMPLLVLTGDLRDSEINTRINSDGFTISIDAPEYWKFHQFGTRKMPARPPYIIDREMQERLGKSLAEAIIKRGFHAR